MSDPSRELEPTTRGEILNPATGELVALDADTNVLAGYLEAAREHASAMQTFIRELSTEITARMDRAATWTAHLGGLTVKGEAPKSPEYDGRILHRELSELERMGLIDSRARTEAVERVEEFKARKRGINALRKLNNPEINAALDRAAKPDERARRVTVTRA
jgi:hypothetical protein